MNGTMRPPLIQSLALHGLVLGALIIPSNNPPDKQVPTKVTWISLASSGLSGGAEANELGKNPQRVRSKQQVAARNDEKSIAATPPDRLGAKSKGLIAKGTNLDNQSLGVAPNAQSHSIHLKSRCRVQWVEEIVGESEMELPCQAFELLLESVGDKEFFPLLIASSPTPTTYNRSRIKLQPIGQSQGAKVGLPSTFE